MGLAFESILTFTFKRAGQVHTVAPESTDVRFRALVHINAFESAMLDHMFVSMATVTFITSIDVDAVASAVATRFRLTFIIILADVPLRVEMVTRVTVTDVTVQAVLALSVTTNVPAQLAVVCVWRDFGLCFEGVVAWSQPDDGRRCGLNNRHTRSTGASGSWLSCFRPYKFRSIKPCVS